MTTLFQAERRAPGRGTLSVAWFTACASLLYWLFRIVWRLRVSGLERLPRSGGILVVSNHQSFLDPPVCGSSIRERPYTIIARESLFRFRPFGALIRSFGAVPIERGSGDLGALRTALKQLSIGRCVFMFPEGTRNEDGRTKAFKPGVALLARKARVPIVPMAIEGATDLWPRTRGLPRLRGRLEVEVGEPIPPEQVEAWSKEGADVLLEQMRRRIEELRMRCRARMRERSGGRWPAPGAADRPYWESDS
jgi:1-acyl-sn-glycerol-3-phosphate acyltransferase